MGSRNSTVTRNQTVIKTLTSIDSQIKAELAQPQRRINILLLGASDSGKSTLYKQMKIIFKRSFTNEEMLAFKPILFRNAIESLIRIVRLMNIQEIEFETSENEVNAKRLLEVELDEYDDKSMMMLKKRLGKAMRKLWDDNKLKIFHSYSFECQLKDSAN